MNAHGGDTTDRARWDARYRQSDAPAGLHPPALVRTLAATMTPGDTVLDLACGFGDGGLFLAHNGAAVTLADVSPVALAHVETRAREFGLTITTTCVDLTADPVPGEVWDLITCVHYLDRALLGTVGRSLEPGGRVAIAIATVENLERHDRPSRRFLVEPGELPSLTTGLDVLHHDEAWRDNGVHEAWLIAEKPSEES